MPNIILDLRECTDEQKHLVLRVMEILEYTWAAGTRATSPPLNVSGFTYLYMDDRYDRKALLYGTRSPRGSVVENYDYVVANISTWFARQETRYSAAVSAEDMIALGAVLDEADIR